MSRPLRIEYPWACYHVMNRGAARQRIFQNDNHYEIFVKLLSEIYNRFQIKIHAYCLMPNHYHLLIQTPLSNLSKAMRHIDSLYTRRHNVLQKRDGPLFRGRFKSVLVDSEKYLLKLSRYIHLNPVAAKMVCNAEEYKWSSCRAYLNKKIKPYWLSTEETLSKFGCDWQTRKYREFLFEGVDEELDSFFKKLRLLPILGSEAFTKNISDIYLQDNKLSPEIAQQKNLVKRYTIDQIMQVAADYYKVELDQLRQVKRKAGNKARQMAIYLSCQLSGDKYFMIAEKFTNITVAGVAKVQQRIASKVLIDNSINKEIFLLKANLMSFVKI